MLAILAVLLILAWKNAGYCHCKELRNMLQNILVPLDGSLDSDKHPHLVEYVERGLRA